MTRGWIDRYIEFILSEELELYGCESTQWTAWFSICDVNVASSDHYLALNADHVTQHAPA